MLSQLLLQQKGSAAHTLAAQVEQPLVSAGPVEHSLWTQLPPPPWLQLVALQNWATSFTQVWSQALSQQ
jgi:hypothetical protein